MPHTQSWQQAGARPGVLVFSKVNPQTHVWASAPLLGAVTGPARGDNSGGLGESHIFLAGSRYLLTGQQYFPPLRRALVWVKGGPPSTFQAFPLRPQASV